jgi:ABC-type glycerol-3-phosphate transport system permease component
MNNQRVLDAVQRRAIRQRQLRRAGVYALAILIAVWILLPIWLIGTMAFSTRDDVYGYPKQAAPIPFSTDTMQFFIDNTMRAWHSALWRSRAW